MPLLPILFLAAASAQSQAPPESLLGSLAGPAKALQADPESVLERAKVISTRGTVPRSSKQILAELLGEPAPTAVRDRTPVTVSKDGVTLATIRKGTGQRVVIEIHRPVDLQQTAAQVARWLDGDPPRDE